MERKVREVKGEAGQIPECAECRGQRAEGRVCGRKVVDKGVEGFCFELWAVADMSKDFLSHIQ